MTSMVLALAFQVLFPIFQQGAQESTGITLVNSSGDAAEFTIVLTSPHGNATRQWTGVVPKAEERFVSLNEMFGVSAPLPGGWARVSSSTSDASAYMTSSGSGFIEAIEPVASPASASILPHVRVVKGFRELLETDTVVTLVNPANEDSTAFLALRGFDGGLRASTNIYMPALGSRSFRVSELFSALPGSPQIDFDGALSIHASTPVAAWQQVLTPRSRASLSARGVAAFHLSTALTAPFFVTGGGYASRLTLTNTGLSPLTLDVAGYDEAGRALGQAARLALGAGETKAWEVASLLNLVTVATYPGPSLSGTLLIREPDRHLVHVLASMTIQGFDAQQTPVSMLQYWVREEPGQFWEIPFAAKDEAYFNAFSIANPSIVPDAAVEALVVVYSRDGRGVDITSLTVPPLGFVARAISFSEPAGYIRVLANAPVVVIGTAGTRDGQSMDAIAARRLPK